MDKAIAQAEKAASVSFTEAAASLIKLRPKLGTPLVEKHPRPSTSYVSRPLADSLQHPSTRDTRFPSTPMGSTWFSPRRPGFDSRHGNHPPLRCQMFFRTWSPTQQILRDYGSLDKCALEEAPSSPEFHSMLFVVLKASGAFHLVIDLSFLNKHVFTQVSDGNGEYGVGFHQTRRLNGVSRPEGFLLASANTSSKLSMLSVRMESRAL